MNVLEEAIIFATNAHVGQKRKMSGIPYILHPVEVANIIATMTNDLEIMAAGVLHDTIEDCDVDPKIIKEKFGPRVSALVQSETEDKLSERPPAETWKERKEESLIMLSLTKDMGVKIMWLADKLSNMRSFVRSYHEIGDELWEHLHQHDPAMHKWYYETIAEYLIDLKDFDAYKEYVHLMNELFEGVK